MISHLPAGRQVYNRVIFQCYFVIDILLFWKYKLYLEQNTSGRVHAVRNNGDVNLAISERILIRVVSALIPHGGSNGVNK